MAGVNIIPSLDPWADVWEKTGTAIGEGLMTGYKKGKRQKEFEELGLDFSTAESTIDSMRKYGSYLLENDRTEEGISMLSKAMTAASGLTGKAPTRPPQATEGTREAIGGYVDEYFDTSVFDFMDPNLPEGYNKEAVIDLIYTYTQMNPGASAAEVTKQLAEGKLNLSALTSGTSGLMQQGGTALTRPAPPAPTFKY